MFLKHNNEKKMKIQFAYLNNFFEPLQGNWEIVIVKY